MSAVCFANVHKRYRGGILQKGPAADALSGFSLEIPEGTIYALVGQNGAGKSTALKSLVNLVEPDRGTVRIGAVPSVSLSAGDLQQIGYVAEGQDLPDEMTVAAFLRYCSGFYQRWDSQFCARLVERFELPPDRKLGELSRGMRIKTALASSLAYRPKLLILDEPFSGLDPLVRDEFVEGVIELVDGESWTVIVASHEVAEIERLADSIALIDAGKVQCTSGVEELSRRYVSVILYTPATTEQAPALPRDWHVEDRVQNCVRLVVPGAECGVIEQNVLSMFPKAESIHVEQMSLRENLVFMMKQLRKVKGE